MIDKLLRPVIRVIYTPLARLLMRLGITADAVTVFGTVVVVTLALTLFPTGRLTIGAAAIGFFALFDNLDGILARLSGTSGPWGAFLDATCDRLADGAVFTGIVLYFVLRPHSPHYMWGAIAALACLVLGGVVPYARARADALGVDASVGVFERSTRLVFALAAVGLMQLGLPVLIAVIVLTAIAAGSLFTVFQRSLVVRRALRERAAAASLSGIPEPVLGA